MSGFTLQTISHIEKIQVTYDVLNAALQNGDGYAQFRQLLSQVLFQQAMPNL